MDWRGRLGGATLQVGDPLLKQCLVIVEPIRIHADFGDAVPDSDLDDLSDLSTYRGSMEFSPGLHTIVLTGSADCEIEVSYYVIVSEE